MTRRADAQFCLLRAILRHGPSMSNEQLQKVTGLDRNGVECGLTRAKRVGRITTTAQRFVRSRRITVTKAGHEYLEDFEMRRYTKGVGKKPSTAYQGEAKTRPCLSCGDGFDSEWPGHRICGKCRNTMNWRDGYDPECYTTLGGQ